MTSTPNDAANDAITSVDDAQREEFWRNGAIRLRSVVTAARLDQLRAAADDLRAIGYDTSGAGDAAKSSCFHDNTWALDSRVKDFLFDSGIATVAAQVLRSTQIRLYEDIFIYKNAGVHTPTPWHQDETQWPMTGTQFCSVWLSTEETTRSTGALTFVTGSHRGPLYTPFMPPGREHDLEQFEGGDLPDVDGDPARYPTFAFDTDPGDVVVFHPRMVHGAFGSSNEHPRRTFSFRMLGDDIRWKRKQCVYLEELKHLPLADGEPLALDRFPVLVTAVPARGGPIG